MSRGGRGGFGGGRGGGKPNGAMQLVSFELLKDAGNLFDVQTALFPELDVPIPRKSEEKEILQWHLRQEHLDTIRQSPYFLQASPPRPDIERYSDKYKNQSTHKKSLCDIRTNLDFFPEELHSVHDPRKARKKKHVRRGNDDLQRIEALLNTSEETKDNEEGDKEKTGEKDDDASDLEPEEEYEEEELFDDNDYAQNYFDNGENEDVDDDDGEPEYS